MFKGIKSFFKSFSNMLWGYKKVFKASPEFVICRMLRGVLEALQSLMTNVFVLSFMLTCIEEKHSFEYTAKYLLIVAGIFTLKFLFDGIISIFGIERGQEKIRRAVTLELYEKAVKMDISFYDDPKFYNDFVWSMTDTPLMIISSFDLLHWLVYFIVTTLVTGFYIASTDIIGIIAVLLSVILRISLHIISVKKEVEKVKETKPLQRKRDYINRVFYLKDFAKDIRLSNIKKLLFKEYKKSSDDMANVVKKYSRVLTILGVAYYTVTTLAINFYLLWLLYGYFYLKTIATLGMVLALHNAMSQLSASLTSLANSLPKIQQIGLYIEKMREFLQCENTIPDQGKEPLPHNFDISFKNVSFTYPGSDKQILNDINLTIPQGSKIALVGYNGAGKSTLVKLMMRLYDPTVGEIMLGNKNFKEFPLEGYRDSISTLFQDFQIMAATLGENITMSDEKIDKEKAEKMLDLTGFSPVYNRLPLGLDTPLTKEFKLDGVEFSGGESQKIAIARVLYSDARLLILDEPSSALDPLSEYTLNHTINDLAGDRTIIFISHRLSTTRIADKIFMLEKGRIVEEGSHGELMAQNGKYAKMFLLQAQKYR